MLDKDLAAVVAHEYVLLLKDNWIGAPTFPNVTAEANYSTFLLAFRTFVQRTCSSMPEFGWSQKARASTNLIKVKS